MSVETAIQEIETEVKKQQKSQSKLTETLAKAGQSMDKLGIDLDIENATFEEVHQQQEALNASIAELIIELDEVTSSFGQEFDRMRQKTGWESFVGVFSKTKADTMRESRVRNTDVDSKLNDLIAKSDIIVTMLQNQLTDLKTQEGTVTTNLETVLEERVGVVETLEGIRKQLTDMDPRIIEAEQKIAVEQNAAARTRLEKNLQKINEQHNQLVKDEQVKLALSQTYEKYIKLGQTFVDSLQNQVSTQLVLIDKLQTDTNQRVILYDALSKSLKTAQQQDIAHRINEIGSAVDHEAQASMAAIGAATNQHLAEMLEAHTDNMAAAKDIQAKKVKADERFMRRFAKVIEEHNRGQYEAEQAQP
jgi:hypothetical protein